MNIPRLAAMALILLSTVVLGGEIARSYQSEWLYLGSLILLCKKLRDGIRSDNAPLPLLLSAMQAEKNAPEPIRRFYEEAKEKGLSHAGRTVLLTLKLSEKAENAVRFMTDTLGKTDTEEGLRLIGDTISILETERAEKEAELPQKKRLSRTLSLCLGLAVVMILW